MSLAVVGDVSRVSVNRGRHADDCWHRPVVVSFEGERRATPPINNDCREDEAVHDGRIEPGHRDVYRKRSYAEMSPGAASSTSRTWIFMRSLKLYSDMIASRAAASSRASGSCRTA